MNFEKILLGAQYVINRLPFLVSVPSGNRFNTTIPYISKLVGFSLIKIGIHDLGDKIYNEDAVKYITEILEHLKIDKPTIVWLDDIGPIVFKKQLLEYITIAYGNMSNMSFVFSGASDTCFDIKDSVPCIDLDEDFSEYVKRLEFTYIRGGV